VRRLGIAQARTPFRSPRANAIAERWVRSVRTECLDHVFIFNERHLAKVFAEYVGYFNHWRPHRSIGQRAPCHRRHLRLIEALKLERSLQYRCLEVSITFISGPLDVLHQILAPYKWYFWGAQPMRMPVAALRAHARDLKSSLPDSRRRCA
jgi:hypothetical protein